MTDTSTPDIAPGAQAFLLPGNATGILIIHGYGGSIGDYQIFAQQLHNAGFTVSGICLPGHGRGQQVLRTATVDDWRRAVTEAAEHLRRRCQRTFVVGSSFGAVLALDYALNHPRDCDGLTLVNAAMSYRGGGLFQAAILKTIRLFTPYIPKFGMSAAERARADQVGSARGWPIDGILATARFAQRQVRPNLARINAPTLFMFSADDPVVGAKNSLMLQQELGATIKRCLALPTTSHRPFRDEAATKFMSVNTIDFIRSTLVSGPIS